MKKWSYIISLIIIIIIAVFVGMYFYDSSKKENSKQVENYSVNTTDIVDEKEYSTNNVITIQTVTEEEKISPNAVLILKKNYEDCGHDIKEYSQIPEELVNLTQEELKKEYSDWKVEKFSSLEVILAKEVSGVCNEHYLLKEEDGFIMVYKINNTGEEELLEETGITTMYLPTSDKMKIKAGIKVYGRENLNSVLEDFE